MKTTFILCTWFLSACTFDPSGVAYVGPDAVAVDTGSDGDAASGAVATIVCSTETVGGHAKQVLTFGGDIETGFLGDPPHAAPVAIEYGTDPGREDSAVASTCPNTWAVPYQAGCMKPLAAWGARPKLVLEPEVDFLNVTLRYADGSVRWGDLKTADGDAPGFEVSGSGPGYDCRIELVSGGDGGYLRIDP